MDGHELFTKEEPSFAEILKLRNAKIDVDSILKLLHGYKEKASSDYESFLDGDEYLFCIRALNLLKWQNNPSAIQIVLDLYETLSHDEEEEILRDACAFYLEKVLTPQHHQFLYEKWKFYQTQKHHFEYDVLILLIKSGFKNSEVKLRAKQMIWDHPFNGWYKPILTGIMRGEDDFQSEVKSRLRFISPIIKYMAEFREENDYFDEWDDLGAAWVESNLSEKVIESSKLDLAHESDEEFILKILGHSDDRSRDIMFERFEKNLQNISDEEVEKRVGKLARFQKELLEALPAKFNDWANSLSTTKAQREEFNTALYEYGEEINLDKKIGRNDPCYCGSGKKFKKCCLA